LGDASHVGLLAETAGRTGDPAQSAARQSLYRLSATKVDAGILKLIPDSDPDAKVELIRAVGQRGIDEAAQTLLAAARSGPGQVRIESLKVLKDSAGPEHVQPLLQLLLNADNRAERRQAEVALAAAAAKQKDTRRRADAVLAMLPSVTDVQAKSSLLSVLGKIGSANALAAIKESLKDTRMDIRTAAIRALSDWPTSEPIETLRDTARNADQATHRALAFRGFVRLAGLKSDRSPMATVDLYREAMGFAANPGEKKLVLAQLAKLGSFEALQTTAGYLDDSELQSEAQVAVVGIAESTWPAHP
jgi:hypothetical protein